MAAFVVSPACKHTGTQVKRWVENHKADIAHYKATYEQYVAVRAVQNHTAQNASASAATHTPPPTFGTALTVLGTKQRLDSAAAGSDIGKYFQAFTKYYTEVCARECVCLCVCVLAAHTLEHPHTCSRHACANPNQHLRVCVCVCLCVCLCVRACVCVRARVCVCCLQVLKTPSINPDTSAKGKQTRVKKYQGPLFYQPDSHVFSAVDTNTGAKQGLFMYVTLLRWCGLLSVLVDTCAVAVDVLVTCVAVLVCCCLCWLTRVLLLQLSWHVCLCADVRASTQDTADIYRHLQGLECCSRDG